MSTRLNKTVKSGAKMRASAHLNWMGGNSWDVNDPFARLHMAAASCFFGEPQYYHAEAGSKAGRKRPASAAGCTLSTADLSYLRSTLNAMDPQDWRSKSPRDIMESTIDECLAADVEKTLQVAVELRNADYIRVTPQVIMVRAAMHEASKGTGLIGKYAPDIIRRGDEPATQLAYFLGVYGKGGRRNGVAIPTRLRKAWKKALERLDEYQLGKYRMENRAVKTIDVVRLVRAHSDAIDKLVKDELRQTGKTWEAELSEKGNTAEAWRGILPRMNHMGMLRNLRNMTKAGLRPEEFLPKLVDTVARGKQLPFRYYSAYRALEGAGVGNGMLLDGVEECLMASVANLPQFPGKVMSLCDNSGSARGACTSEMGSMQVSTIANLTAILTGLASEDGYIGVFGDRLDTMPVRKRSSVFDMLKIADRKGDGVGGGTENGIWLFWDKAIKEREHWDYVFVYSDMQAGHGGLYGVNSAQYSDYIWGSHEQSRDVRGYGSHEYIDVPKLVATYRTKVNPKVKVFLVQVAGYTDTIMPEFYDDTYILGGWSANVLRFAARMAGIGQAQQAASKPVQV